MAWDFVTDPQLLTSLGAMQVPIGGASEIPEACEIAA